MLWRIRVVGIPAQSVKDVVVTLTEQASVHDVACALEPNRASETPLTLELLPPQGDSSPILLPPSALVATMHLASGLTVRVREAVRGGSLTTLPSWATVKRIAPIAHMFHPNVPSSRDGDEPEPAEIVFNEPPSVQRIPFTALLLPLIAGITLFVLTASPVSLVMALLTPLVFLANTGWGYAAKRRFHGREIDRLERQLDHLARRYEEYQREQEMLLRARYPSTSALCRLAMTDPEHVWWVTTTPERGVTFSLGTVTTVLAPVAAWVRSTQLRGSEHANSVHVTLVQKTLKNLPAPSQVPRVMTLQPGMRIGVVGDESGRITILTHLVMQLAVRYSPAILRMHCDDRLELKQLNRLLAWLPHSEPQGAHEAEEHLDVVMSFGDAVHEEASHSATSITLIAADRPEALPPDCGIVIVAHQDRGVSIRQTTDSGTTWAETNIMLPGTDSEECEQAAMRLAGILPRDNRRAQAAAIDHLQNPGLVGADALPPSVTLPEPAENSWEPSTEPAPDEGGLAATMGITPQGPFTIDLRAQGPHALVGGTTGAGKSEFLQTWVLALAAAHAPTRVNFLFIDYKGGAAFAECTRLPHAVGLVTDLTPHLAQRALVSLRAELTAREELLLRKRVKRVEDLERAGDPDTPPALVIVIDEFAALSAEVPEFVDGVIDIAQRGRSLGFHLILATQRPAGVVTSNLRANTNLRIALRTADESDSIDVIGTNWAAHFPQDRPGRAAMVTGSSAPTLFQSAYTGGPPEYAFVDRVTVADLHGSSQDRGSNVGTERTLPSNKGSVQERIVETLNQRAKALGLPPPRRPWIAPLAPAYDLTKLRQRTDTELLLGVADQPTIQQQGTRYFEPEREGHIAVVGAPGSGKSSTLRTLAIAAGITPRGGAVHVYGIDCGSGGLSPVDGLPQVASIVRGDSVEGVHRTLQYLGQVLDERQQLFTRAGVETLRAYQDLVQEAPQLPRILLLIDDVSAWRTEWEHRPGDVYATLTRLLAHGRNLGIHVAITASRGQDLPAAFLAHIGCRVVLRQSDDDGYTVLGVPRGILTDESPPGRAMIDGDEVQIAIIGGTGHLHEQRQAITHLSRVIAKQHPNPASPLRTMPEVLTASKVPRFVEGRPVLGLSEATLEPVTFEPSGVLRVAAEDPETLAEAVAGMMRSLDRAGVAETRTLIDVGSRSPFTDVLGAQSASLFDRILTEPSDIVEALETLTDATGTDHRCVVLFGIQRVMNTEIEEAIRALIGAGLTDRHPSGALCIIAATTKEWSGHYGLIGSLKEIARGVLVQPGPHDGEQVFGVRLPPSALGRYPKGRAVAVSGSRAVEVQLVVGGEQATDSETRRWVL